MGIFQPAMLVYQRVDFLDGENGEMVGGLPTSSSKHVFLFLCQITRRQTFGLLLPLTGGKKKTCEANNAYVLSDCKVAHN